MVNNSSDNALLPPSTLSSCTATKRVPASSDRLVPGAPGDNQPATPESQPRSFSRAGSISVPTNLGSSTWQGKILNEVTTNSRQIQDVDKQVHTLKESLQELLAANCRKPAPGSADAAFQSQILHEMRDVKNHLVALEMTVRQHVTAHGLVQSAVGNMESRLEARLEFMQHAQDVQLDSIKEQCATIEQTSGLAAKRSGCFSRLSSRSSSMSPRLQTKSSPRQSPRSVDTKRSPRWPPHLPEPAIKLQASTQSSQTPQPLGKLEEKDILNLVSRSSTSPKKDLSPDDLAICYQDLRGWNRSMERVDGTVEHNTVWNTSLGGVQLLSTLLVLANIVFIDTGVREGMKQISRNEKLPDWIFQGDLFFTFAFMLEMLARVWVERVGFVRGPWRFWNFVDIVIITLSVLEVTFSYMDEVFPFGNLSYLRVLKILRVVRVTRCFRWSAWPRGIRLILDYVSDSFFTVCWIILVLMFFLYLGALGLTQLVEVHIESIDFGTLDEEVLELYGSVSDTMLTLLMAVSGGAQWRDLLKPLESVHLEYYRLIFAGCVVGLTFGVLNLLLAIIIEIVHDFTVRDSERTLSSQAVRDQAVVKELKEILIDAHTWEDGKISEAGFSKVLHGDGAECLATLGLEAPVAKGLFGMLDADHNGRVRIEELACSIMQLKSNSAGLHVATVMYESKKILMSVKALSRQLQYQFACLYSDEVGAPIQ